MYQGRFCPFHSKPSAFTRPPAFGFPEEPLESVGTWLPGPLFGPGSLSTATLDRSASEFRKEPKAGYACTSLFLSHKIPAPVNSRKNISVLIPKPRELDTISSVLLAFMPISINE